jgi:hypothetical protein
VVVMVGRLAGGAVGGGGALEANSPSPSPLKRRRRRATQNNDTRYVILGKDIEKGYKANVKKSDTEFAFYQ